MACEGLDVVRLADALAENARGIQELRGRLPEHHRRGSAADDLFLLRYVLSFKGSGSAVAAAVVKALEWRQEHAGLVAAARSCVSELDSSPLKDWISGQSLRVIDDCLAAKFAGQTGVPKGFPLYVIHSGKSKLRRLMDSVAVDDVALWLTWRNEIGFWRCDAASRSSGLLLKQLIVMNMDGMYMSGQDPRFYMAYGKSSRRAEFLHPQLLAKQVVVNPPAFMSYFWAIGRRLVSERVLSKVHVHSGPPEEHLSRYFERGVLPEAVKAALRGDRGTDELVAAPLRAADDGRNNCSVSGSTLVPSDSSSRQSDSSSMRQSLTEGSFVVTRDNLAVFESADSWSIDRVLSVGEVVFPAAPATFVDGYTMQPILPSGAVEAQYLVAPREPCSARPPLPVLPQARPAEQAPGPVAVTPRTARVDRLHELVKEFRAVACDSGVLVELLDAESSLACQAILLLDDNIADMTLKAPFGTRTILCDDILEVVRGKELAARVPKVDCAGSLCVGLQLASAGEASDGEAPTLFRLPDSEARDDFHACLKVLLRSRRRVAM